MLKKRIIPVQLLLNDRLVKSVGFSACRDVGDPVSSSKIYNSQTADELIFLNISRDQDRISKLENLLKLVTDVCFMPLAVGGGISSLSDANRLIRAGADKVVLNTICYDNPTIIKEIKDCFGSQAVVIGIDVKKSANNKYDLFSNYGLCKEKKLLLEHIEICEKMGAGELFIQSIDMDGSMAGYDIELMTYVAKHTNLPIICCGGAGNYNHLKDVFLATDVSAVACGSLFNFTDSNLVRAKSFLSNYDLQFKQT